MLRIFYYFYDFYTPVITHLIVQPPIVPHQFLFLFILEDSHPPDLPIPCLEFLLPLLKWWREFRWKQNCLDVSVVCENWPLGRYRFYAMFNSQANTHTDTHTHTHTHTWEREREREREREAHMREKETGTKERWRDIVRGIEAKKQIHNYDRIRERGR